MSACIFQAVGAFVICYLTKFKSTDCSAPTAGARLLRKIVFRQNNLNRVISFISMRTLRRDADAGSSHKKCKVVQHKYNITS